MSGTEFDVRLTADRVPIVVHHMRIERGRFDGVVADYTASQLTQHEFLWNKDRQPYRIPAPRVILVWELNLSVRYAVRQIGISRSTYYGWTVMSDRVSRG